MKMCLLLIPVLVTAAAFAAELPAIPDQSIAKKTDLLFSDDFNGAEHDQRWHRVVDTFTFEDGALKGTQTREKDIPAADGKPGVKAHAAVYGLELPTKDSVVEVKIKFDGNTRMDVEFDDRKFTGSHYGHLCRTIVSLDKVTILDERDGTQSTNLIELRKDAAKNKDEINSCSPPTPRISLPSSKPENGMLSSSRQLVMKCASRLTASLLVTSSPPASAIPPSQRSNSASPARAVTSTTSKYGTPNR